MDVTALQEGGLTRQVSPNGGAFPVWAKRGEQLLYRRATEGGVTEVVTVPISVDGTPGPATVVAKGDFVDGRNAFDVFPDGSLLMIKELPSPLPPLQVVVNWPALRGLTTRGR